MGRKLNTDAPFARIYADVPMETAIRLDKAANDQGMFKNKFLARLIHEGLEKYAPSSTVQPKKTRRK